MFCSVFCFSQNYSDSISVNLFLLDECKISQFMTAEINDLYNDYQSDQIHFTAYFPNFSSKPDKIKKFVEKYKVLVPYKTDYFKTKTAQFRATVVPEVFVYDEVHKRVLYQGRIDDSYARIGKRRRRNISRDLRNALESISKNQVIQIDSTTAIGCFIQH